MAFWMCTYRTKMNVSVFLAAAALIVTCFGMKEEQGFPNLVINQVLIEADANISLNELHKTKRDHLEELPWVECNGTDCTCAKRLQTLRTVRCNPDTFQLSVIICHCVTFDSKTQTLIEGKCNENCENGYDKSEYLPLPLNVSELNRFMCEDKWNRIGRLCGKCLPGHSPLPYSYDLKCIKCPEGNKNVWKYILVAFGPSTVFYVFMLLFRIKATSLHLHGYLVFSQIVSAPALAQGGYKFIQTHPDSRLPMLTIGTMYTMWNLDFFRGLYPDICLDISILSALALDYAVAIYPLLLTVVSYFLIELHYRNIRIVVILWKPFQCLLSPFLKNFNSKTTVIDAFATFFLLSFVKIATISTYLLIPVRAHSLNNDSVRWVLYYDATVDYFSREHLPYAILGIVCYSVFVIMPILILIVFQFGWFQRLLSCLKLRHQLLVFGMESFQSSYKNGIEPGTRDCRWFSAVPFIGRYGLLLVYTSILDATVIPFVIIFIFALMILTVLVQPYNSYNKHHIKMDMIFWGLLGIFFSINESALYESLKPAEMVKVSQILRTVVIAIPLVYIMCITAYWILSRVKKVKSLIRRIKAWRRGYVNMENDCEATLPDRMVNPNNYQETPLLNQLAH